jgi:uncharacterized protein
MGEGALNLADAWAIYRSLREAEGVDFCVDTESADATLAAWVSDASLSLTARLWSDAWLAAVAESASLRLVSFGAGFRRFPLSRCLVLTA